VQHPPVYTLGKNGKPEHILDALDIPVVNVDRGGQVTYHGPGQLVVYVLLDLKRLKMGVRSLVTLLEQAVIELLSIYSVDAIARKDAPGVYVGKKKIAALGLRVRKGCCFHGIAINVDMDLSPYEQINPCGYEGLEITQLSNLVESVDIDILANQLKTIVVKNLHYTELAETHH
jgi:lipoyl(octanoyl) transferase